MSQNNRKNILINKDFQFRFVLYTFLPTLITQIILWVALEVYMTKMVDKGLQANLPEDHFYFRLINEQLDLMKSLFLSVGLISFAVIFAWALFISHKIAGPFFRMTNMLNEDSEHLKSFKFRPGDFFPEVAEALAAYVSRKK